MESALEAVSLHNMVPTPAPAPAVTDSWTSTADLAPPSEQEQEQAKEKIQTESESESTRASAVAQAPTPECDVTRSDVDSEKLALQLEVRKLRHQLIVSQITAKQFKSECLLYKAKATESTSNKKRKDFCPSPSSKGAPSKQPPRMTTPAALLPRPALQGIENSLYRHQSAGGRKGSETRTANQKPGGGRGSKSRGEGNAAYTVSLIDGSDIMFSNICLRM
jgi:hypothetical protein